MENLINTISLFSNLAKQAAPSAIYRNLSILPEDFWDAFDQMCERLKVKPKELAAVLKSESNFNSKAVNYVIDPKTKKYKYRIDPATNKPIADRHGGKIPQAKGLNQLIWSTAKSLGMSKEEWENYDLEPAIDQLKWVEKYFAKNSIAGLSRGDIYVKNFGGYHKQQNGIMYAGAKYIAQHPEIKWQNPESQNKAYEQNMALDKDHKGYITVKDLKSTVGE